MRKLALTFGLLVATALVGVATAASVWPSRIPANDERGQELYDRSCASCHGPNAKGDGPLAASLVTPVPDLSQGLGDKNEDELIRVVMKGRGAMPGFEQSFKDWMPPARGESPPDFRKWARAVLQHMKQAGKRPPMPDAADTDAADAADTDTTAKARPTRGASPAGEAEAEAQN